MIELTGISFSNGKDKLLYQIPENESKRLTFEFSCASEKEEVACAGGMLLGIALELQDSIDNIPKGMQIIFVSKIGLMIKKIILKNGDSDMRRALKMKKLVFKAGKNTLSFQIPSNIEIIFKDDGNTKDILEISGNTFIKLLTK